MALTARSSARKQDETPYIFLVDNNIGGFPLSTTNRSVSSLFRTDSHIIPLFLLYYTFILIFIFYGKDVQIQSTIKYSLKTKVINDISKNRNKMYLRLTATRCYQLRSFASYNDLSGGLYLLAFCVYCTFEDIHPLQRLVEEGCKDLINNIDPAFIEPSPHLFRRWVKLQHRHHHVNTYSSENQQRLLPVIMQEKAPGEPTSTPLASGFHNGYGA